MPKEIINSKDFGFKTRILDKDGKWQESDPSKVTPEPFLEIGWGRESSHVQVAVLAGGDYDESETPRPGLYIQLDRAGINKAIHTLRRARDAAYGKDA